MAGKYDMILKKVLADIKPEPGKVEEIEDFMQKLKKSIKKNRIKARGFVGGSFAKDTFLKGDHDVDVFVLFDLKYRKDVLSDLLEKILKGFRPERLHGSRDYFLIKKKYNFEVVPVLDIKKPDDAENVTDFSPGHVKWVKKNGKRFRDDIRLAKKFCKGQRVYGAESYIHGFSGHVLDILVIYYKGFINLLKAARNWKEKQVIDYYNVHKGKALFELNKSKTTGNLIVVDPVQPERNAAAAVSDSKLRIFKKAAKDFIKKPSARFFAEKEIDIDKLKKRGAIVIEAVPMKGTDDVVGTKLFKAFEFMKKNLDDFKVRKSGWKWDDKKAYFWFFVKNKKLSPTLEWEGPPVKIKQSVKDFKKIYKKTYIKRGRIYTKIKRKIRTPEGMLRSLFKNSYVKERTKKCQLY